MAGSFWNRSYRAGSRDDVAGASSGRPLQTRGETLNNGMKNVRRPFSLLVNDRDSLFSLDCEKQWLSLVFRPAETPDLFVPMHFPQTIDV